MTQSAADHTFAPIAPLGLIGFGEAAQAFCRGWRQHRPDLALRAFDIKTDDPAAAAGKLQDYAQAQVSACAGPGEALAGADVVFSLVTADQAHAAACSAAAHLAPGALFLDCNSCAPDTKRASARVIGEAGGVYVDVAIMAPVHPKLHRTPLLISGPQAAQARPALGFLGMTAKLVDGDVGRASSIKMMRSVMIKGLEALVLECVLSARKAGVEVEVLASLDASFPGFDWPARAAYMIERTTTHGIRRAAEMREVAQTVADLDLPNDMTRAITDWQQRMGDLGLDPGPTDYTARADAILAALKSNENEKDD